MSNFASKYNPRSHANSIKYEGATTGKGRAEGHYPYAVIEDNHLVHFAQKEHEHWLNLVCRYPQYEKDADFNEIKRLWVAAFIAEYKKQIESRRVQQQKEKEEKKEVAARRQQEEELEKQKTELEKQEREEAASQKRAAHDLARRGVNVRIESQRDVADGVMYEIEFVDPARITRPVFFAVRVGEDGQVEVWGLKGT
jgi:hypothetical protein